MTPDGLEVVEKCSLMVYEFPPGSTHLHEELVPRYETAPGLSMRSPTVAVRLPEDDEAT
jgi:hypothetical protein